MRDAYGLLILAIVVALSVVADLSVLAHLRRHKADAYTRVVVSIALTVVPGFLTGLALRQLGVLFT